MFHNDVGMLRTGETFQHSISQEKGSDERLNRTTEDQLGAHRGSLRTIRDGVSQTLIEGNEHFKRNERSLRRSISLVRSREADEPSSSLVTINTTRLQQFEQQMSQDNVSRMQLNLYKNLYEMKKIIKAEQPVGITGKRVKTFLGRPHDHAKKQSPQKFSQLKQN